MVGGREGASSAATTMVARRARAGARVGRFRARARRCSFRAARVVSSSFAICRVQRHGIARIRGFSRSRPPRERNAHETAAAAASAGTCPRRRRRRRMSRRGRTRSAIKGPGRRTTGNSPRPIDKPYAPHVLTQCSPIYRVSAVLVLRSFIVFWISVFTATTTTYHSAMAYLSHSFDFEHMQNSTNWDAVQKKRSFVARKIHKINKVSVVFLEYQYYILLQFFFRLHRKLKTHSSARLTDLFFFVSFRLSNRFSEPCVVGTRSPRPTTVRPSTRKDYRPKSWRTCRTSTSNGSCRRRSCTTRTITTRTRLAWSPDWACRSRSSDSPRNGGN